MDDDKRTPDAPPPLLFDAPVAQEDAEGGDSDAAPVERQETAPVDEESTESDEGLSDEPETTDGDGASDSEDGAADRAEGVPMEVLLSRMESILFASTEPMSVRKLANILGIDGKQVRELASELVAFYQERGIILEEISRGFQFRTHPKNAAVIRDVFKLKPLKISRAALETLAIVAYRQPLTRAEAEQIRGVDCGGVLKYLFEKELVRVIGRKEEPGRPIIYGTTSAFLELFGLKSLSDLPALHEFSELWEENQRIVDEEIPPSSPPPRPGSASLRPNPGGEQAAPGRQPPPAGDEGDSAPGSNDPAASGLANSSKTEEESGTPTEREGDDSMADETKRQTGEQRYPQDPAEAATAVIDDAEMADLLASIDAPSPVDISESPTSGGTEAAPEDSEHDKAEKGDGDEGVETDND